MVKFPFTQKKLIELPTLAITREHVPERPHFQLRLIEEIRRGNQLRERSSLSYYLQCFIHTRWCRVSCNNSIVKTNDIFFAFLSQTLKGVVHEEPGGTLRHDISKPFSKQQNQTVRYRTSVMIELSDIKHKIRAFLAKSCQCRLALVFSNQSPDKGTTIRFELPMNLFRRKHLRVRRLSGTDNGGVPSK